MGVSVPDGPDGGCGGDDGGGGDAMFRAGRWLYHWGGCVG